VASHQSWMQKGCHGFLEGSLVGSAGYRQIALDVLSSLMGHISTFLFCFLLLLAGCLGFSGCSGIMRYEVVQVLRDFCYPFAVMHRFDPYLPTGLFVRW